MLSIREDIGGLGNLLFKQAYLYSQLKKGLIPDIYLQSEEYFENVKEEVKAIFGQGITPIDMVSLHVRRGDYKENPFYVNLQETDYYEKAMEQFPDATFLVFCADRQNWVDDVKDMEWCKNRFQGKQFEFYQAVDEIDDFNTMAGCKNNIIANSSFSHMCGIVNPNPNKKVIAPIETKYYTDGVVRSKFPKEFIQLDFKYE